MKNSRITYLFVALFSIGFIFLSCNQSTSDTPTVESADLGKEYTSAYICPMHCEGSGSEEPGNCPVCTMEYQKNENHTH